MRAWIGRDKRWGGRFLENWREDGGKEVVMWVGGTDGNTTWGKGWEYELEKWKNRLIKDNIFNNNTLIIDYVSLVFG